MRLTLSIGNRARRVRTAGRTDAQARRIGFDHDGGLVAQDLAVEGKKLHLVFLSLADI
jgi:hypothetical protein